MQPLNLLAGGRMIHTPARPPPFFWQREMLLAFPPATHTCESKLPGGHTAARPAAVRSHMRAGLDCPLHNRYAGWKKCRGGGYREGTMLTPPQTPPLLRGFCAGDVWQQEMLQHYLWFGLYLGFKVLSQPALLK